MAATTKTFARATSQFRWNAKAQRYVTPSGQFVAARAVKDAMNSVIKSANQRIRLLAIQVGNGLVSIADWQKAMVQALRDLHLASAAAGKGGFAQLTQADYGRVGSILRFQYQRLDRFARQIEYGKVRPAQIAPRAEMYGNSGARSYEEARRSAHEEQGFDEERRTLGAAEHCGDCIDAAMQGWQPIGSLPPIGESVCLTNCKCTFQFRVSENADNAD